MAATFQWAAAPTVEPIPELTIPRATESPVEGNTRVGKAPSASRPREAVRESIQEPAPTPPDHSLADETSALDRARASVEAHRFAEALRLLGEYHSRFPQGRMRPEATVLRLTALIESGQHEAARALADRLLNDDTYQTYAPRIRSLLRGPRGDGLSRSRVIKFPHRVHRAARGDHHDPTDETPSCGDWPAGPCCDRRLR